MNGISLRLIATFLMAAMSACVHAAAQEASIGQIIFYRCAVAIVPIIGYTVWIGEFPHALKTRYPVLHIKRGLIGCVTMFLSFASLMYLPVANATALAYMVPLFSVPLAAYSLKESVSRNVIVALLIGFAGVIAMLYPSLSGTDVNDGILIGTIAGVMYALTMGFVRVHIKKMTESETPASIAFYFALICAFLGLLSSLWGWEKVGLVTFFALIGAGVLGGLAHIASTESIARSKISILAPFEYTGLIWAFGFDIFLFAYVPNPLTFLGSLLIIFAAVIAAFGDKIIAIAYKFRA